MDAQEVPSLRAPIDEVLVMGPFTIKPHHLGDGRWVLPGCRVVDYSECKRIAKRNKWKIQIKAVKRERRKL